MEDHSINKLTDLIVAIIKRPAMYQVSNVEDIYLIVFGYSWAIPSIEPDIFDTFLQGFKNFVNEYFAEDFSSKKDYDWSRLIRFYSAGDSHSIELFGKLFEQFTATFKDEYKLE